MSASLTARVQLSLLRGTWPEVSGPLNLTSTEADELADLLSGRATLDATWLLAALPLSHPGLRAEATRVLTLRPPGTPGETPQQRLGLATLLRRLLATAGPGETGTLGAYLTPDEYSPVHPPAGVSALTLGHWLTLLPATEQSQLHFVWPYALTESRSGSRRNATSGDPSAHPDLDWADWIRGRPLNLSPALQQQRRARRVRLLSGADLNEPAAAGRAARLIRRSVRRNVEWSARHSAVGGSSPSPATLPDQRSLRLLEATPEARAQRRGTWSHHVVNLCLHLHSGVNSHFIPEDIFTPLAGALITELRAETDPQVHASLRGGLSSVILAQHRARPTTGQAQLYQLLGAVPEPWNPGDDNDPGDDSEPGNDEDTGEYIP